MTSRPAPARLVALDQLRALAVLSMCVAHFAPGLVERFQVLQPFAEAIGIVGRLSTVAFVVCFGLTLGFVQFPKYAAGKVEQVNAWLLGRAKLLAVCVLFVSLPGYIELATNRVDDAATTGLWHTYGVLNVYVLALLSAPLWFWILQRDTAVRAAMLSALHWMGFAVLIQNWPPADASPVLEFLRLNFVSGGYAYLPLATVSLLAIPLGISIRERAAANHIGVAIRGCALGGAALAAFGFGLGLLTDMSAHGIADGSVKGPVRLWYWALFSGIAVLLLAALAALRHARPAPHRGTRYVALFGQSALGVYTLHAWVLPILSWIDQIVVVEGAARAALAGLIFASFCGLAMRWYARKSNTRRPRSAPPAPALRFAGVTVG